MAIICDVTKGNYLELCLFSTLIEKLSGKRGKDVCFFSQLSWWWSLTGQRNLFSGHG